MLKVTKIGQCPLSITRAFIIQNVAFKRFVSYIVVGIFNTHNNVIWDWQYFAKYSPHSVWMWGIFLIILPVPRDTIMDVNNVMPIQWYKIEFNTPNINMDFDKNNGGKLPYLDSSSHKPWNIITGDAWLDENICATSHIHV